MNPDISSNIQTLFIEEEATLFKIYWGYFFANGKARDIKGYQAKILNRVQALGFLLRREAHSTARYEVEVWFHAQRGDDTCHIKNSAYISIYIYKSAW